MANKRKARYKEKPVGERSTAIIQSPDNILNKKIGWRFNCIDKHGKGKASFKLLDDYFDRICFFEQRSRKEIEYLGHCHPCAADKLSDIRKNRIQILNLDIETLYQLKLDKTCRLWVFWEENIFNVIWLDKEHDFYK